jgi:hypothetical protein
MHRTDEAESAPGLGADETLAITPEHAPQCGHGLAQAVVGDVDARPELVEQPLFAEQAAGMFEEQFEQVAQPRRDGQRLVQVP